MIKPPAPPKPPPARIIREGNWFLCPKCGSTATKKYWLFGKLTCIQEEVCEEYHNKAM